MAELKNHEVRITYGDGTIEKIEMLLLPKAKLILDLDKENNAVKMNVLDTDFMDQNLSGSIDQKTLDGFIKQLIKMYRQLDVEEE